MLLFSIPLIPNTILWWITNMSDRYIISMVLGAAFTGLYVAAYKIPSLCDAGVGIFMDAWQISAITEQKARDRFYTKVVDIYSMLLFVIASGAILMTRVIPLVLFDKSYYDAWRYIPLPVVSIVFTCLVNFLGSIYMVEKRSIRSLLTAMLSAVINIASICGGFRCTVSTVRPQRRSFVTSWFSSSAWSIPVSSSASSGIISASSSTPRC